MSDPSPTSLTLLATFIPPNPTRAWQSAPHPTLPILATCFADKTVRIYSLTSLPASSSSSSSTTNTALGAPTASPNGAGYSPEAIKVAPPALLSTITGGHKRSIRTVAWKPPTSIIKGESVLATGSFDASVGIWRRFETGGYGIRGNNDDELDVSSTGGAGEHDHDDDDEEWNFSVVLDGHESEVKSIAWSAGGNLLATCSRDKSVWIWEEVGSGEEAEYETVAVLQEHEGDVKAVAWHPEEECLVSGSYDDEVRVWRDEGDDWGCVFRGRGHGSTVWGVAWEGVRRMEGGDEVAEGTKKRRAKWRERRERAGPRFLSCSDDGTVRVWRKVPREREKQRPMSIIRSRDAGEEWVHESTLPKVHERSIYAVGWSERSGQVVSCGGDGRVVVYEESWRMDDPATAGTTVNGTSAGDVAMDGADPPINDHDPAGSGKQVEEQDDLTDVTIWKIIAQVEAAHGVFEINHVAWARKPKAKQTQGGNAPEGEGELIVTTGDDGAVKVWDLDI